MLSEAEQRRLSEIEAQLQADDPAFVKRFDDRRRRRRWQRPAALVAALVAAVSAGVGLVVGSVGIVVVAFATIGAGAGAWIALGRRH